MRIKWTPAADRDLDLIEQHISRDNPRVAVETVLEIVRHADLLPAHPGLGRPGRIEGTRELVISGLPYVIAYIHESDCVIILRVLHAAMKWPSRF